MKKELFLTMLAILISFFTFKAIIHASDTETEAPSGDDYCEACCTGRTVATDCCQRCNYCQAYDDEAAAECRDYPA